MTRMRVLRYRIDVLSVLTVVVALGVQLAALLGGWPWYAVLLILPLLRQVNLVEHNHAHLPIFVQRWPNEILSWMCFLSNGVPLEFYEIHHVANHHRHNQRFDEDAQDWSSLFGFAATRYPDRPIGRGYYVLSFPLITICHCLIVLARSPGTALFRRYLCSAAVVTAASGCLIAVDPIRFLLFFPFPWIIVQFGLGYNNYCHHHGCKMTTRYDAANDDLGLLCRFLGFNIGYHVAHHLKPGLHWSLLPRYREAIKAQIPPENDVQQPAADAVAEHDRAVGDQRMRAP